MGSPFTDLLLREEQPILERFLSDAEANGYFGFVPSGPEEWRPTVRGLSGSLAQASRHPVQPPHLAADEIGREDGHTAFLVVEARKRRLAGTPLSVFLGIVKLLRRAYEDRIRSAGLPPNREAGFRLLVERFFDRNETAAVAAWNRESLREQAEDLAGKREEHLRVHGLVETAKTEWERTIDCVDDMILLSDSRGLIRRCNRAFQRFVGKPYEEILDRPCQRTLCENGFPAKLPGGKAVEHYHEGAGRWFVLRQYPFQEDPDGYDAGTIVAIQDVTEVKNAATELERGNARLKEALAGLRRTQDARLRQERTASVGRMAEGMAREVSRPIGVVTGNLTALGKHLTRVTGFLAEQSACISQGSPPRLVESVRRKRKHLDLDNILRDLADLVGETLEEAERVREFALELKEFSGTAETEFRQADVNECLREALLSVRGEFRGKASLTSRLGKVPRTRCLPHRVTRAFADLLRDAARSVREGGAVTARSWTEGGYVCVAIHDAKRVIPGERLGRVFEPFSPAPGSRPAEGLGLSVAYDIVRKHNGEIRVGSVPGKGTTYTVLIPLVKES